MALRFVLAGGKMWCMCVVLSSGLRMNSYTPAGCVREVLLCDDYFMLYAAE